MKIAVIILNYFGFQDTCSCVKSVRENLDVQFFLVDNSASLKERKQLEGKFQNSSDVKLLFPQENLGFAAGVNLGLKEAINQGFQHFFLLNNDAVMLPDSGNILTAAVSKNTGSLIAPSIIWGENINQGNYYNKYLGLISDRPYFKSFGSIYYFTGCALAFDKIFIDKVGFLDENFFFYGEDIDYSYRTMKKNVPLVLIPENLIRHKGSKSAKKASLFYEYHILHAHWLLIFKIINNPLGKLMAITGKLSVLSSRSALRSIKFKTMTPLVSLLKAPRNQKIRPENKKYTDAIN
jgi:GT2 family glycosyltransferase